MTSNRHSRFFTILAVSLCVNLMGCSRFSVTSDSAPSTTPTPAVCQPSPKQVSKSGFPEIRASMHTEGEAWALLFFDQAQAGQDLKIVWRITGTGDRLTVQARNADGTVISPVWGPDYHESSDWERPGQEWGTGFNFPKPGCWVLTASRGTTSAEIRLEVLAP